MFLKVEELSRRRLMHMRDSAASYEGARFQAEHAMIEVKRPRDESTTLHFRCAAPGCGRSVPVWAASMAEARRGKLLRAGFLWATVTVAIGLAVWIATLAGAVFLLPLALGAPLAYRLLRVWQRYDGIEADDAQHVVLPLSRA
ncbi:hypothetical protein Cs7R123_51220 [Catellatospora sp. TT07R-123]|uniref:hypothetical protein n=1 Tax=Catellatospora sp. TT07R-123 TaxID=2733863 RepID=UPI001B247F86|nr:hypothetical protein [Catellatospora sp. TT07R-123]GHJ47780.1 hypothetical protein Cs7R123_51220 [Catellatospora sp. TT07R-123]